MKQHGSVFMLFVRSSFYKILLILLAMIVSEGVWFYGTIQGTLEKMETGEVTTMTPEVIFEEAHLMAFFGIALILVTVVLACVCRNTTGRLDYTLYRLNISPKSIVLWQAAYSAICLLVVWFVQVILAFCLCRYYMKTADAGAVTHQSLFLAFYRSPFLHGILPLQNFWCWIRNVLLFATLGGALAYDVYCSRRGKNRMWTWWLVLYFGLSRFQVDLSEHANTYGAESAVYAIVLVALGCITLAGGVWNLDEAGNKK